MYLHAGFPGTNYADGGGKWKRFILEQILWKEIKDQLLNKKEM